METPKDIFDDDRNTGHRLISDGSTDQHLAIIKTRGTSDINGSEKTRGSSSGAKPLIPLSPLEASATVVNLVLATGPFAYP